MATLWPQGFACGAGFLFRCIAHFLLRAQLVSFASFVRRSFLKQYPLGSATKLHLSVACDSVLECANLGLDPQIHKIV